MSTIPYWVCSCIANMFTFLYFWAMCCVITMTITFVYFANDVFALLITHQSSLRRSSVTCSAHCVLGPQRLIHFIIYFSLISTAWLLKPGWLHGHGFNLKLQTTNCVQRRRRDRRAVQTRSSNTGFGAIVTHNYKNGN